MPQLRSGGGSPIYSGEDQLNDLIYGASDVSPPVPTSFGPAPAPAPQQAPSSDVVPSEMYGGPAPEPTTPYGNPNAVVTSYPAANQGQAPMTDAGTMNPNYTFADVRQLPAPTTAPPPSTFPGRTITERQPSWQDNLGMAARNVVNAFVPSASAQTIAQDQLERGVGGGGGGAGMRSGGGGAGMRSGGGGAGMRSGAPSTGGVNRAPGVYPPGINAQGGVTTRGGRPAYQGPGINPASGNIARGGRQAVQGGAYQVQPIPVGQPGTLPRTLPSSNPIGVGTRRSVGPMNSATATMGPRTAPRTAPPTAGSGSGGASARRTVGSYSGATMGPRTSAGGGGTPGVTMPTGGRALTPEQYAANRAAVAAANAAARSRAGAGRGGTGIPPSAPPTSPIPTTGPARAGGWGLRDAAKILIGGGVGIAAAGEAANTLMEPAEDPMAAMLRRGGNRGDGFSTVPVGDSGGYIRVPTDPNISPWYDQEPAQPTNRVDVSSVRPSLMVDVEGNVTPYDETQIQAGAGTGPFSTPLQVFVVDNAGQLILTDPAALPYPSLTAALERGEQPWKLDDAEFDALMAAGLLLNAEGEPISGDEVETWRAALVGANILAPKPWLDALGAEPVTFEDITSQTTAPVDLTGSTSSSGGGGSSSGGGGGNYSRGGGYRGGYGGGGYSGGGGYGYPGTMPSDAAAFMGPDFMGGMEGMWDNPIFDRYFATRDSGWPFGSGGSRRSSRFATRRKGMRGRSGRIMRNPRQRSTSSSSTERRTPVPSGRTAGGNESLDAALALRDRKKKDE